MKKSNKSLFIGIDLGGKGKKTTGVCILEKKKGPILSEDWGKKCQVVKGKELLDKIGDYLSKTKVIAIDAPLTKGQGKGDFRLYQKFLSTKIFRKEDLDPVPPALMSDFCSFGREVVNQLEERGFSLNLNLIEVYPKLIKESCGKNLFSVIKENTSNFPFEKEDRCSALVSAIMAHLHFRFETRYLGYRDGFLFLPQMSWWKKEWRKKFYEAWMARDRLKYKYLTTNMFNRE